MTLDPGEATCRKCTAALERDLDDGFKPNLARAYGRASRLLRDRHPDEWDECRRLALAEQRAEWAAEILDAQAQTPRPVHDRELP